MAISNPSGLTINYQQTGIQYSKVTDSSADWSGISNNTYFYDLTDKLVHYKDSSGAVLEIFSSASGGSFTGGTVAGATIFTGGLTSSTLSATTYYNLPQDIYVTGATYSAGTAMFTNSSGGTFSVSGFTSGVLTSDTYWVSGSTGFYSVKTLNNTSVDATGDYAYAEGINTLASGETAHAEGFATIAGGGASHAEGDSTTAIGTASHSEGQNTQALGAQSHTEGRGTIASGDRSHAEGDSTIASGNTSHAEGANTQAIGSGSHAEGNSTIASGLYTHTEGAGTQAIGDYSHAEGGSTIASGNTSHAEGANTKATGDYSHAEGNETTASGNVSHSEGNFTTAAGNSSHAEGSTTTASGYASHTEGEATTATGGSSHAEGFNTKALNSNAHAEGDGSIASGIDAHAEGDTTLASGYASHSEGGNTIALGQHSHAGGLYSVASGDTSFVHGDSSFAGGIGTVVLGNNITGLTDNTVYVNNLNINSTPSTGTTLDALLVRTSSGEIKQLPTTSIGGTSGVWGISNSAGTYTYYSTWSSAMAAATSGQTVELFAEISETTNSYILKNGVNVNGNGHSITFTNSGHGIMDNDVAVNCKIFNLQIIRDNPSASGYRCLYIDNIGSKIYGTGSLILKNDNSSGLGLYLDGECSGIIIECANGVYGTSTSSNLYNFVVKSFGTGYGVYFSNYGYCSNGVIESTSTANYGIIGSIYADNLRIKSNGYGACGITYGTISNSFIKSITSVGAAGGTAEILHTNCYIESNGSYGVDRGTYDNCTIISTVNRAVRNNSTLLYNCKMTSYLAAVCGATNSDLKMYNCILTCLWNNANGHGTDSLTTSEIVDCTFIITNSSAYAMTNDYLSPNVIMYGNKIKGTSKLYNAAFITQKQINTADAQGNIILN